MFKHFPPKCSFPYCETNLIQQRCILSYKYFCIYYGDDNLGRLFLDSQIKFMQWDYRGPCNAKVKICQRLILRAE